MPGMAQNVDEEMVSDASEDPDFTPFVLPGEDTTMFDLREESGL